MPVLISALLALQSVSASPTLAEVEADAPARAGELLLAGRTHGEIVSVTRVEQSGPNPPGVVELDLVEAARAERDACVRRRWRATFQQGPDGARFTDAFPMQEVALPTTRGCAAASFAHVNPGIPTETALAALRKLRRIVAEPSGVEVACSSSLDPALCTEKRTMIARLAAAPAWAVAGKPGAIELWLGKRGEAPITVDLDEAQPDRVTVSREAPAPF